MTGMFDDDDYYTGPPLNADLVRRAEKSLGVRLPVGYIELLSERNGGVLRRRCCPTEFATSWADDHFEIQALLGIGGEQGIDSLSGLGSADRIAEWEYPKVGVVIFDMPSGGHDTVMLDYTQSDQNEEPAVVYVDEDRIPKRVADSFNEFIAKLKSCADMNQ